MNGPLAWGGFLVTIYTWCPERPYAGTWERSSLGLLSFLALGSRGLELSGQIAVKSCFAVGNDALEVAAGAFEQAATEAGQCWALKLSISE